MRIDWQIAYRNSLEAAESEYGSIAFPYISTGIYQYPLKEAAEIAIKTVSEEISNIKMDVLF